MELCPSEAKGEALFAMDLCLSPHPISWPEMEPDASDDPLTAFNKEEKRRDTKLKDRPDVPKGEWKEILRTVHLHIDNGISEAFLVSSLILMVDDTLKHMADEEIYWQGVENARCVLEGLEEEKRQDNVENASHWDHIMKPLRSTPERDVANLKQRQDMYQEWRSIPFLDDLLKKHRIFGHWENVLIAKALGL